MCIKYENNSYIDSPIYKTDGANDISSAYTYSVYGLILIKVQYYIEW